MRLNKERRAGNRGKGGRPRADGERYENGRLKADRSANAAVVAQRAGMGLDKSGQAFTPLGVAAAHGWLDERDIRTAQAFIAFHHAARLDGPRVSAQGDLSNPEAVDVRVVDWERMPGVDILAIWESAFGDVSLVGSDAGEAFAARAMARWKAACKAMSADQRREVVRFCIDDSWPQWILQRRAGRMGTSWERQRDLLVAGLRAIAAGSAKSANDRAPHWEGPDPAPAGPARTVERTAYVDADENELFVVERVARSRAA